MRRGHNKEDQFDPEEAGRINSTDLTPRSSQTAGIPEAEVVNNSTARKGKEERTDTDHTPWRQSGELLQHESHIGSLKKFSIKKAKIASAMGAFF
ncbi:hypothetical protein TNCV_996311 [Trichonephila clavipes]|nr:hypothetical protein TNCV_996311 [Trichonephila clavipes]